MLVVVCSPKSRGGAMRLRPSQLARIPRPAARELVAHEGRMTRGTTNAVIGSPGLEATKLTGLEPVALSCFDARPA